MFFLTGSGYWFLDSTTTMSYAPKVNVTCPTDDTLFRTFPPSNTTLNPREESYIQLRSQKVVDSWTEWINGSDVDYNMTLFNNHFPRVAFSYSGGSLRGSLVAAGVSNAYDARNETARKYGTGGFWNVASYVAGLSGGSWAVSSSSFANQSTTFPELVSSWLLEIDLIQPGNKTESTELIKRVLKNFEEKNATEVPSTLADLWSSFLAPHFLPGTNLSNFFDSSIHGAGLLWSDIASQESFQNATIPFPIVISCSRNGNETSVSMNDVVYEMTPIEFGSYDPPLNSMINMKFAGTALNMGKPETPASCLMGFDQASFIISSSSDIFDDPKEADFNTVVSVVDTIAPGLKQLDDEGVIQALWPNPFQGINPGNYSDTNSSVLKLDDGSEGHDNVPLEQILVNARNVDVIVVIDATSETTLGQKNNFPNGTSLLFAERRLQTLLAANHQQLPPIPDDFAKTGNNLHVSIFGCDPVESPPEFPLMVYVPNSPPCTGEDPVTNPPSTQSNFSQLHQQRFLDQAFLSATCGFVENATGIDTNFPTCLKCAAIDRARLFSDPVIPRSDKCQSCFDKYCFNPKNPPSNTEFPGRKFLFVSPDDADPGRQILFVSSDDSLRGSSSHHKHVVLAAVLSAVLGSLVILGLCGCIRRRKRHY